MINTKKCTEIAKDLQENINLKKTISVGPHLFYSLFTQLPKEEIVKILYFVNAVFRLKLTPEI